MAISASRVTRFGIGGGIWQPAGDFSGKEPGAVVTETFSGGFFFELERQNVKRDKERRKRLKLKRKAQKIQDKIDREIALEFRKKEEDDARLLELKQVKFLAEQHKQFIADNLNEKILFAAERAIDQGNFSAMEALERQLQVAFEEEQFMLEAFRVLVEWT